jgi:hypothetical protein
VVFDLRIRVLTSVQRALLGVVTPNLRAVAVSFSRERVEARFIYDSPGDDDVELMQEAETQVMADFDESVSVAFRMELVTMPAPFAVAADEVLVYLRREPDIDLEPFG